jgi:hypothetical protein
MISSFDTRRITPALPAPPAPLLPSPADRGLKRAAPPYVGDARLVDSAMNEIGVIGA